MKAGCARPNLQLRRYIGEKLGFIGLLFLQPYVAISRAAFYEDLKAQQGGSVEVNVEVNVEI